MNVQSLNSVTIIGRLGSDPRVKSGQYGSMCSLSIATTRRFHSADGNVTESTMWIPCSIFGKQADNAAKLLHKGDLVCIIGGVSVREANERQYFDVRVQEFQLLNRSNANNQRPQASMQAFAQEDSPIEHNDPRPAPSQPTRMSRPANSMQTMRTTPRTAPASNPAPGYPSRTQRYQQAMRNATYSDDPTDLPFEEMGY